MVAGLSLCRNHAQRERKLQDDALVSLGRSFGFGGRRFLGRNRVGWTAFAVERACSLTNVEAFAWPGHTFRWYEVGALGFLGSQHASGGWTMNKVRAVEEEYTSFAILFLTRGSIGRTRSRTGRTVVTR